MGLVEFPFDDPKTMEKVKKSFEAYFESDDFKILTGQKTMTINVLRPQRTVTMTVSNFYSYLKAFEDENKKLREKKLLFIEKLKMKLEKVKELPYCSIGMRMEIEEIISLAEKTL